MALVRQYQREIAGAQGLGVTVGVKQFALAGDDVVEVFPRMRVERGVSSRPEGEDADGVRRRAVRAAQGQLPAALQTPSMVTGVLGTSCRRTVFMASVSE